MPEMNREEIAKLEALYASNPEGRVFTHLAEAYRKAGDYERARGILQQGLTRHPGYASAYVVLGRVQLDIGENDDAEASFRRVLELDPHNLVALRSLGDIARAAGRREQALAYFEELRHQDPGNDEVERFIADLRSAAPEAPAEPAAEEAAAPEPEPAPMDEPVEAAAAPDTPADEFVPETEPAPEPEPEQFYTEETRIEAEQDLEIDQVVEIDEGFELAGALDDMAPPEPDFGDLVTPDIELNWEGGEPAAEEAEALPGDLADFAGLNATFDILDENVEPAEPPPAEEMPDVHFPDVGEPADIDAELAEAEAESHTEPGADADVVTETMARLYRDQGLYTRAAEVYRQLLNDRPYDQELQRNLAEVEALAAIIGSDATAPDSPAEEPETEPAEPDVQPLFEASAPEPEATPEPEPEVTLEPAADEWEISEVEIQSEWQSESVFELENQEIQPEPVSEWTLEPEPTPEPDPDEALPFMTLMPDEPVSEESDEGAAEEEAASPWTSPQPAAAETPNPYTWTDEQPEEETGQPIQAYFRDLLSWRPARTTAAPTEQTEGSLAAPASTDASRQETEAPEPEPEVANFAAPPEMEAQPAVLDLTTPAEPPADELMPWEEPASPSMPTAPLTPAAEARPSDPVDAAFEEWFSSTESDAGDAQSASTAPETPSADSESQGTDNDDDDDLEMFRSWLQSLKK